MRIRKRQVPLPLSSLLPVPLSDLYFHRSPADGGAPPPSDVSDRLIRRWDIDGRGFSDHGAHDVKSLTKKVEDEEEETEEIGGKNADPAGPETVAAGNTSLQSNSPSPFVGTRSDHEGGDEKMAPLKNATKKQHDSSTDCNGLSSSGGMNSWELGENNKKKVASSGRKKKGRGEGGGGGTEEGSRCSRVNGRGWRCCQQTLVGYSLCDHHLGKGRLRKLANNKDLKKKNKVKQLGVVKARSITSLLGQTSSTTCGEIAAPADHSCGGDK